MFTCPSDLCIRSLTIAEHIAVVLNPNYVPGEPEFKIIRRIADPWTAALAELLYEDLITIDDYNLLIGEQHG